MFQRVRVFATTIVLLAAVIPQPASAAPATPEERAAAVARPAVVYVEIRWTGWVRDQRSGQLWLTEPTELVGRCTGFGVSPDGYILTAGHCVDPGVEGVAGSFYNEVIAAYEAAGESAPSARGEFYERLAGGSIIEGRNAGTPPDRTIYVQRGVATSGITDGRALPARLVSFAKLSEGDQALLKVEEQNAPSIELAPASEIEIGTPILAVGYPASTDTVTDETLEPTNKDGKVSAKRTSDGVPFYEISAATSRGMSGGPAVDMQGRVVGTVSFGPAGETQAFNFISPSSISREILTKNGVRAGLGKIDTRYRQGLAAFWDTRYDEAVAAFDQVLDVVPSHQQAQEYRQRASERRADAPPRSPSSSGLPVVPIAAVAALLVLGGIAAILLRGRRKRATARPAWGATASAPAAPVAPVSVPPAQPPVGPAPIEMSAPATAGVQTQPATPEELARRRLPTMGPEAAAASPVAVDAHPASNGSIVCPSCGAGKRTTGRFCGTCGASAS